MQPRLTPNPKRPAWSAPAMRRRSLVPLWALLGLLTFAPAAVAPADALAAGTTKNAIATSITTVSFILAATLPTAIATNPQAALALSVPKKSSVLFKLVNFGTLNMNSFRLTKNAQVTIYYCVGGTTGGTFDRTSTCANTGVLTQVMSTTQTSVAYSMTILAGANREFSAKNATNANQVASIEVSVGMANARAPMVTNF
jgi:hypothetical protein